MHGYTLVSAFNLHVTEVALDWKTVLQSWLRFCMHVIMFLCFEKSYGNKFENKLGNLI